MDYAALLLSTLGVLFCAAVPLIYIKPMRTFRKKSSIGVLTRDTTTASSETRRSESKNEINIVDYKEACDIIAKYQLVPRSIPFDSTKRKFMIENAFTTMDKDFRFNFLMETKVKLNMIDRRWRALSIEIPQHVRSAIIYLEYHHVVPLRSLVQMVVLSTSLHTLFPEVSRPPANIVYEMAICMNYLFHTKEVDGDLTPFVQQRFLDLQQNIFPQDAASVGNVNHPMSHIQTAYGAVERVALRCFLEILFRDQGRDRFNYAHEDERSDVRALLDRHLRHPDQSITERHPFDFSIQDLIKEGLRMYPPPMPIYRQAPDEGPLYIIETEKINRSRHHWGDDADTFDPSRWTEDGAENKPFLSFGVGRYSCPTQRDWGFRVIGLVVVALIQETEARGYVHLAGKESEEVIEIDSFGKYKPLQSERAAYPFLELRK